MASSGGGVLAKLGGWLDRLPLPLLVVVAGWMALAPFYPEPHLWEKLKMLVAGTLVRPIDIFDLLWHAAPLLLLGLKLMRMARAAPKA